MYQLDARRLDAYLARIGLSGREVRVSPQGLRELQAAHLDAVPFENLDIHLGSWIDLDEERIVDKLLSGRGGFCYELNGAFAALLRTLGFEVTLLEARVYDDTRQPGIRFDHLCLRVDLEGRWLADVGFGQSFRYPLRLEPGIDQLDPDGTFRLAERQGSSDLDLLENGVPRYRLDLAPRRLDEFEPGCHHHQTSSASHFTRSPVCSRPTDRGRVTIRGARLIETVDGIRTERELDEAELRDAYRSRLGIALARLPG